MSQLRQVSHVRIREVPQWIAYRGLVVWCGATQARMPGYRVVWVYNGPTASGVGSITLTFLQANSQPPIEDDFRNKLNVWAIGWTAHREDCIESE